MKKKLPVILIICCIISVFLACGMQMTGSIKTLTKPYIASYECVEAKLGNQDMLEKYEFINITLIDSKEMEISFKQKDGDKKSFKGAYTYNTDTHELTGEIGILGFNFKEGVILEKGEFTITKNFLSLPLIMKFKMK